MPTEKENKKRIRRDRKEEILQAATHLFSINGFRGTSLASIAEEVGLTEQGVLHYFPSKANLLQSVFAYRDQQDEDKYSKFIDRDSLSLEEMFDALEKLVAQNEQIPGLVRLFSVLVGESIRNDHPSHEYFDQRYKRIRDVFTEHL
ncbi:MAG: TetR/AcrR family transcriptional regulator, partial [Chloroflexota bacterium]